MLDRPSAARKRLSIGGATRISTVLTGERHVLFGKGTTSTGIGELLLTVAGGKCGQEIKRETERDREISFTWTERGEGKV